MPVPEVNDAADVVEIELDGIPFGDAPEELPRSPGQRHDVGVLFIELCDPDSLAVGRSAPEVGAILESFFKTVGAVTEAHGGYAERSDLCAVGCVFGAPAPRAADAALSSGRELRQRLAEELPEVEFGIGISVGASAAGWIQATRRFEPITICAPMSEASRLCELAKRDGPPVVASERALARASSAEADSWSSAARAAARFPAATLAADPAVEHSP